MLAVLEAFAVIAVIIAVGAIVGRRNVLGDNARMVLNRVAFHSSGCPRCCCSRSPIRRLRRSFSLPLLVSALTTMIMFGIYFAIAVTLRRSDRADATIGAWAASWVNSRQSRYPAERLCPRKHHRGVRADRVPDRVPGAVRRGHHQLRRPRRRLGEICRSKTW